MRRRPDSYIAARLRYDSLGVQVGEVELQLALAVCWIQRSGRGNHRGSEEGNCHFGAVWQHNADSIAAPDARCFQRPRELADAVVEVTIAERHSIRRFYCNGAGRPCRPELQQVEYAG